MRIPTEVGRKVLWALVILGFILVIVPVHLLDEVWEITKRLASRIPVSVVWAAIITITVVMGVLVSMNIRTGMPDDPAKYEVLCADMYGCGGSPMVGAGGVLAVAIVLGVALMLTVRVGGEKREVDR